MSAVAAGAFWLSAFALLYTYIGYPVVIALRARSRPRRVPRPVPEASLPTVSMILAVRNEEQRIESRLANLLQQDYPRDRFEVIVASDGSSDATDRLVERADSDGRVSLVRCPAQGKASALNTAVGVAHGEVLAFTDARQLFAPDAVRLLVKAMDSETGAVSGRLQIGSPSRSPATGIRDYWGLESWLRMAESRTGSVVGVTGAIYAARRNAFPRIPEGVILDDLYVPLRIAMDGLRVGYVSEAVAYDEESKNLKTEFRRKVRTLTGNYQLVRLMPGLLNPARNPLFVRFLSHKLLRLASPAFLTAILVASGFLPGAVYYSLFLAQTAFYGLGLFGLIVPQSRRLALVRVPAMIVVFNAAAAIALWVSLTGRQAEVWTAHSRVGA